MSSSYHHTPRSKQPVPPVRHRSSSGVRSSTNSYASRPRSVGYYGNTSNPYTSTSNPYSSPYGSNSLLGSSYGGYGSYGSSYQSPYFPNGYRGGYASLTIPAKSLTSHYANKTRGDLSRGNSYRERSVSRSRNSLPGMGSRSLSLTSLNSEGYISGSERSSRSRINSTVDIRNENGEIDYKKLYEEQLVENDRLKEKLRKSDEELRETKQTLERINVVTSKNSLSELEKRERRAMERKLSEMEEELKNLDSLKSENQRLKDENGALIRVISKLSK